MPVQAHPAALSEQYKRGLDRAFRKRGHSHVIVLEAHMQLSPDFLLYFEVDCPEVLPCRCGVTDF